MNKLDEKAVELSSIIGSKKQQLDELARYKKIPWRTNCSFPNILNCSTTTIINIQTVNEKTLLELMIKLLMHKEFRSKAESILNIKTDVMFYNYSYDDWEYDLIKAMNIFKYREAIAKFEKLEARLDSLMSDEQKRAKELNDIEKILNDAL